MRHACLLLVLSWGLAGCSQPDTSPEQRVYELILQAEQEVEARRRGLFEDRVAAEYSDAGGRGRRELLRLLSGYYLRHQTIHLLTRIDSVESDGERIRALVYAGMAGSPVQGFEQLLSLRAGLYRFDLEFSHGDEPMLIGARWRRAGPEEVLPDLGRSPAGPIRYQPLGAR